MYRRLISLLLVCSLVFSALPVLAVHAEEIEQNMENGLGASASDGVLSDENDSLSVNGNEALQTGNGTETSGTGTEIQ